MSEKYPNTPAGVGSASLLYGKLVPLPASFNGIKYISRLRLNLVKVSEVTPLVDSCNYFSNWSCDKTAFAASSAVCDAGGDEAETPGETGPEVGPGAGEGVICWDLEVILVYNYIQNGIQRKSISVTRIQSLYRQV